MKKTKVYVLLFNEDQQGFHSSYLSGECSSDKHSEGWVVIGGAEANSKEESILRGFSTHYRSLGVNLNSGMIQCLVDEYINNK